MVSHDYSTYSHTLDRQTQEDPQNLLSSQPSESVKLDDSVPQDRGFHHHATVVWKLRDMMKRQCRRQPGLTLWVLPSRHRSVMKIKGQINK